MKPSLRFKRLPAVLATLVVLLAGCKADVNPTAAATGTLAESPEAETSTEVPPPPPSPEPTETSTFTPEPLEVRFAVIGDYGLSGAAEAEVAALVHSWEPDIIITTGDNNYPSGSAETIDENIGQYYHDYISPYLGSYGAGAEENRFR